MPANAAKQLLIALMTLTIVSLACAVPLGNKIDISNLTTDLCKGPKVPIQLTDKSTASNNEYSRALMNSDGEVEISGRLSCVWEESYQSAESTGLIRTRLELLTLTDQRQADELLYDLVENKNAQSAYCKEIEDCTVTHETNTVSSYLYAEENITGLEEGKVLPSYHTGSLISWVKTADGFVFINLFVDHPELEPGSTFVKDTMDAVEGYLFSNLSIIP